MQEQILSPAEHLLRIAWSPILVNRLLDKLDEDNIEKVLKEASRISRSNYSFIRYEPRSKTRILTSITARGTSSLSKPIMVNICRKDGYPILSFSVNVYGGIYNWHAQPMHEIIFDDGCESLIASVIDIPDIETVFGIRDYISNVRSSLMIKYNQVFESFL